MNEKDKRRRRGILLAVVGGVLAVLVVVLLVLNRPSDEPEAAPQETAQPSSVTESVDVAQGEPPVFKNVSVHDPSIVKDGDTYYVFGSHIDAAKSTDLIQWTRFTNGYVTPNNKLYGDLSQNLAESFAWAGENDSDSKGGFSVWAPDVFWNKDFVNEDGTKGAWLMYYSASSTYIRSAIGYAASKTIEGPYKYVGTVMYSGFTKEEAYDKDSKVNKKWTNTNIKSLIDSGVLKGENPDWFNVSGGFNNVMYPNAIDANLFYDENGKLWMSYGSWSGGIFLLEMDPATGKAIYPGEDGKTEDGRMIDRYFGIKISGGYTKSGEGPYIVYDKKSGYYFLYVTYGWLGADGAYNMRQFRSEKPEGPYMDAQGLAAVLPGNMDNFLFGNKLISNFQYDRKLGEAPTGLSYGYVSAGHNSVYMDPDTGAQFLVFHSRFPLKGEGHEVRVHQMFMNKDGWPVVAAHRYSGEKLEKVDPKTLTGEYKFIDHGKDNDAKIYDSLSIRLNGDGTINGAVEGTWALNGDYEAVLTIKGATYNGVFIRLWDSTQERYTMTFTVLSNEGVSVWGSKIPELTDKEVVEGIERELSLGNTDGITANLTLPTEGTRNAEITWQSSDVKVVTEEGVITRPEGGAQPASAVLTATIKKGQETATKAFKVSVNPFEEAGLAAHYAFEDNLTDAVGKFGEGTVTGDRIDNTGGAITYVDGKVGKSAVFDGKSGVLLPKGLIVGNSYSVSVWLKPEELTQFTTTFFGAADSNNWVSLVPDGPANRNTMVWSGSGRWFDAPAGMTIAKGQWTHVAFTLDKGVVKLYINGTEKFSGKDFPNIFTSSSSSFSLGVNWWDPPFKGQMDELRIYAGALSPAEIRVLATE